MRFIAVLLLCFPLLSIQLITSTVSAGESQDVEDGIAFQRLVARLWETDTAILLVQSEMGLSEERAMDFVYLIQSAGRFIKNEEAGIDRGVACELGVPAATGDNVYQVLEEIFEVRAQISDKHLQLLKKDLSAEESEQLQNWLDRSKTQINTQTPDYAEILSSRGVSPDSVMARLCGVADPAADSDDGSSPGP